MHRGVGEEEEEKWNKQILTEAMFPHCMWWGDFNPLSRWGGGIKSVEDDSSLLMEMLICHTTKITDIRNKSFFLFEPF